LVKPIFLQLTENLSQYVSEAEALAEGEKEMPVFIENYLKQSVVSDLGFLDSLSFST